MTTVGDTVGTARTIIDLSKDEKDQLERSNKKANPGDKSQLVSDEMMIEGPDSGEKENDMKLVVANRGEASPQSHWGAAQWSYKDRLLGVNGNGGDKTEVDEDDTWEEDDFSDDEEEIKQRKKNVLCPGIDITRERRIGLCRPWRRCLIIKVLGREVGYRFLHSKIQQLWKISGAFEMIDIPNNFWLVRFSNEADYDFAMQGGPWMVAGHYLMCQRWRPEFDPNEENVRKQAVWVRIPGLPIEYYEKHLLWELGNEIGRTLKVDEHSINERKIPSNLYTTERGQFARMCVEVDLRKTLVPMVHVRWKEYPVEYEGLSLICFECGCFGHQTDLCPLKKPPTEMADGGCAATENTRSMTARESVRKGTRVETNGDLFGPWMIAQRRKGRPRMARNQGDSDSANQEGNQRDSGRDHIPKSQEPRGPNSGSRYDTLNDVMEEDLAVMGQMDDLPSKESTKINADTNGSQRGFLEGHKVAHPTSRPKMVEPNNREQEKNKAVRQEGRKKNVARVGSQAAGSNKGVEGRLGRSPRKAETGIRIRERSSRPGPVVTKSGSIVPSPVKLLLRDPGGDAGPSKLSGEDSVQGTGDGVHHGRPPDDVETWRMMKYEEQRLKLAGQDPNDLSSVMTRVHTNFL